MAGAEKLISPILRDGGAIFGLVAGERMDNKTWPPIKERDKGFPDSD